MTATLKKPTRKESVGAQYICFDKNTVPGQYSGQYEAEVEKTQVVKSISVTENNESNVVRASGIDFDSTTTTSSIDIAVEVVAFEETTKAKMRGDIVDSSTGLITTVANAKRPYFGYGKVVHLVNGKSRFEWYPKCQLVSNSDDVETSEGTPKEMNDTYTIRAFAFNEEGQICNKISEDSKEVPNLTEEKFFSKVILAPKDITEVATGPVAV